MNDHSEQPPHNPDDHPPMGETAETSTWMPPTEIHPPPAGGRPQAFRYSKGDRIGPYTLKKGLGVGGFGEVWLAERRSPDLTVAIKVLRPEVADKRSRGRFEAEAQALALLSHEGIASIHEASVTDRGEPYIAMQYIEGLSLTRYCDSKRLRLEQRMELMSLVCEAVHHAHTRGIIHRDLKPENILVTEVRRDLASVEGRDRMLIVGTERDQALLARPKILDFGLAKAINRNMRLTEQTLTEDLGKLMGTLEYMAPEQTAHEPLAVDTRADIFALGVMTYELITGVLPLPKEELLNRAIDDAVRRVRATPRPDPSTRFSSLDAELSAQVAALRGELAPDRLARVLKGRVRHLVGKALRLEPERRFTSTAAMARDIRHYLAEEPFEEAAAEPIRDRVWLAVKRRPLPYAIATLIMLLLIGGVTGTTIGMVRAVRAERTATANQQVAEGLTTRLLDASSQAAESMAGADAFASIGRAMLDSLSRDAETPDLNLSPELGAVLVWRLGQVRLAAGELDAAKPAFEAAIDRFESPSVQDSHRAALARLGLAEALFRQSDGNAARPLAERALSELTRLLGPEHSEVLLARESLAGALKHAGFVQEAVSRYEELLVDRVRLGSSQAELGGTRYNLALALERRNASGDLERALELITVAATDRESALGLGHVETINAIAELARMQKRADLLDQAEREYRRAIEYAQSTLGGTHWRTIQTKFNLGSLLLEVGQVDEGLAAMEEARIGFLVVYGPQYHQTIQAGKIVAGRLARAGKPKEGLRLARRVLEQAGPAEDLDVASQSQVQGLQELITRLSDDGQS